MGLWIKNTRGKKDAMLTFATLGFALVVTKILFGGNEFHLWTQKLVINPIDASTIAAILTPTLGAYVARQHLPVQAEKPADPPADVKKEG